MSAVDPFADPFAEPPAQSTQADTPAAPQQPVAPPAPPVEEAPAYVEPPAPVAPPEPPAPPEPTAADLEPSAPPPVVDKEGIVQAPAAEVPAPEPTPPVAPPAPTPEPSPAPPEPPVTPPSAPEEAPAPPAPPVTPTEPSPDVPAAPAVPASTGATEAASTNGGQPAEPGPNDPKKGHRHYVLLYQTGPTTFEVCDLGKRLQSNPALAEFVKRVEEPAAKEGDAPIQRVYLEARNNEHAYKLSFSVMGRPENGCTVLPLPKASWRPRRVAPAPPQPERERLTIS